MEKSSYQMTFGPSMRVEPQTTGTYRLSRLSESVVAERGRLRVLDVRLHGERHRERRAYTDEQDHCHDGVHNPVDGCDLNPSGVYAGSANGAANRRPA